MLNCIKHIVNASIDSEFVIFAEKEIMAVMVYMRVPYKEITC